ncbi:hypothetical protein NL387_26880, partial [Klebsiella pneumoniae]|nr:hypothetical protein [Klebsiella pneumoniae]
QLAKCRDSIRVVNTFMPHGPRSSDAKRDEEPNGAVSGRGANVKLNAPPVSVVTFSNEYVSGGAHTSEPHEHANDDSNGFAIVVNGHSL